MQPRAQALGVRKFDQAPAGAKEIMAQTSGNVGVHLVFSTKERRPLIAPELAVDLFAYLGGIIHEMRATALIINGTSDHVHMLVRLRPSQSVSEIARVVKTNSSRLGPPQRASPIRLASWIRSVQRERVQRSGGHEIYCIAGRTSQEAFVSGEFVAFLKKNNVAYDERYIWE